MSELSRPEENRGEDLSRSKCYGWLLPVNHLLLSKENKRLNTSNHLEEAVVDDSVCCGKSNTEALLVKN